MILMPMKTFVAMLLLLGTTVLPMSAATLTFGTSAPTPTGSATISNWTGATFDADNVGGSGTNANGSPNNGAANDATTYVATNRAAQGETFTTGSNAGGYKITAITVRAAGYTNNTASGSNTTTWGLNSTASTFYVRVGQISGTTFIPYTIEYAASGATGNPGVSNSANGSGTYLTFTLKAPIVLLPNTVYAFDIGTTGDYFEMLGIRDGATGGNPYANGTAYTSGASGAGAGAITTQTGDRVFMVDLAPYTAPTQGTFVHPGLLNTAADYVRMRNNVALGVNPWATGYSALTANWMGNNPNWSPHAQATITRSGTTNDTSRLYNDIAVAYGCALRWKVSGDTAYADEAVRILNAWGNTLTAIAGDTNANLCNLYGYQFACVGETMRTYPGWAPADFAQFQTMMSTVFYPLANDFLTRHNGTDYSHYWANWDLCAMDDIYAIGVLTDNPTLTNQAITYFKSGLGNGCIDRATNFIHPGFLGQGQEIGRDQGHASLDMSELATFCQMTWNQGSDMFGYENNRVLSMAEYTAKYNLFNPVPFAPVWSSTGGLMTGPSSGAQGATGRPGWATFYNHYVNVLGLAAPYTQTIANQNGANWSFNGDDPGWDYLTASLPPIATGANPSSLTAIVTAQQPVLSWWGSAYATGYNVLRSTTSGSGYTTIATGVTTNTYTDTSVVSGTTYYYVVNGTISGGTTGNSNEAKAIIGTSLYAQLKFDETSGTAASDSTGNGWAGTLVNGATWTTGTISGAVNLSSASSQYVNLPNSIASDLSDFTISAWVNLSSISTWARIFDIGYSSSTSANERYMMLTASNGSAPRFAITHSGGNGQEGINSNIPLPTSQWVHVAVTLNGPIGTLYVNGNAVGQNRNMYTTPNRLPGGINYAYIGKSGYAADPYLNGKVDDFRIYRGPLSVGAVYTLATGLAPATPPSAPTNLTVTAQAGNQSLLSWTASSGATSYTVLRATSSGGPYSIVATIVSGTSYVDTGLTAGTTYYYEVDGANSGGDGAVSTASSGVVALPPMPSVPAGFTAVASSATTAALNWTATANAYSYNVKRSLTSGGPYTTIAGGLTVTTFNDTGLTTGTPYYYVVSAVNTAGESVNSAEADATPSDLLVHLRFDEAYGTNAMDASGNGWNATLVNTPVWGAGIFGNALGLTSASTQYGTLGAGVVSTVNDFTISVWVNMTTFASWARAYDFGTGTTNYMFLAPQGTAAGKPRFSIRTPSVAEQVIDSSVAIPTGSWTQITVTLSSGVGKMYINGALVGTNSAMTLTPASLGSTTQNYFGHSQFGADPYLNGSIDDFRINSHAFTATQVAANASPSPATPTGLSANPSDGLMTLNWAVSETATTYKVKRATVKGGPYTTVSTGLTTPTFVDTGLTDGTTYYYVVSAVNWLGESANSTETAGTPYSIAWAAQDIGTTGATGSSSASGATVTVTGSGADIWGTADTFQFRSVPVTGDCVVTARVWSETNANAWSKAGVMIRDSLAANAMNAFLFVTPTTTNGIQWQSRTTTGGTTSGVDVTGMTAPYWVRLVRTGTTIQGYRSPDGVNWTPQGSATLSSLGSTAYVGLAVTSHVSGTLCTATFDNVSVNWIPDAPSTVVATPAPFQVALSWNNIPNATSYNVYSSSVSGGPYTALATGLTSPGYVQTGLTSGATVYYIVTGVNIAGEGSDSDEINAAPIVPPVAPGSLSTTGGSAQVALGWTTSTGATSYTVKRSTTSGGSYSNVATGVTSASYTDTGLANGTTYYYVVSGVNSAGEGANSAQASATTLPSAPTSLAATGGNTQVALSWTASGGATSYTVKRSATSGGSYSNVATGVTSASYTDTGLANGSTYYYVVAAINASGSSPNSTEAGTITLPGAPAGLSAAAGANQATLTWSATTGAASYTILSSTTNGGPYNTTVATGVATTSYTNTGLANGTTYYYVVEAVDASGNSPNSVQTSALTLPAAPTGFSAVANSNQVTLTWSATTGAASYTIGQSTTSGGPYTTIASGITATSYTTTGLTNGTTYYYVVSAVNATGTGANSAQISSVPTAQPLYWDTTTSAGLGNGSGNWDINTTPTWSASTAGTNNPLLTYLNDDTVYFQTAGIMTATIASGTTIKVGSVNQAVNGTATTITGGTLQIDTNSGITNGVGSGNQALTINSPIVLNSANVTINNATTAGSMTLGGAISQIGSGSGITLTGAGTVILNGANTFTGATTISAGTLQFNSATAMSSASTLTLGNNTTLSLFSSSGATFTPAALNGMSGGGAYNFVVNSTNTGQTLTLAAGPVGSGSSSNTTINVSSTTGGTLKFGSPFQIASNSGAANGGPTTTFNMNTANLILTGLSNTANNCDGGIAVASTTGGSLTLNGTVSTNTNRTLFATLNSGVLILNNSVSTGGGANAGFFVTVNGGTLQINNTAVIAATRNPGLTIVGGTVGNSSGAALTESNNPSVGISGNFTFGTATDTGANSLNLGTGAVTLNVANATITTAGAGTLTLGGGIGDGGNGRGITKAGSGNLTLSGANTYTGTTTVNAGKLWINGSTASGSALSVNSGATLGGTGTINGATTVASGGILTTGSSGAGTLTFAGGLSLNGGAVLSLGLGTGPGKIALSAGTYTAPGSGTVTLNLSSLTGFGVGTYNLITGATGISAGSFTLGATPSGYTYALSASSGTLSITVSAPGVPTGLAVDGYTVGNNLTWTASSGATSYSVLRSTGGAYTTIASGVSGTVYTDTTAVNGTTYSYEVTATNLGGTSAASTASSVTTVAAGAYLKFDEGSGTTVADATGNSWTGTLVNTPTWVAGRSVNAVSLNGTNQYLTLPTGVVSSLTTCTIAMWVNLDATTAWSRLFDFGTGTTKYMFLTANSGSTARFAITTNGTGSEQRINGTGTLPIGGWHHVAVTLAGAVGTLYIDGVQVGQNTAMTLNPSSLGSTTLNYIGRSQFSADPYLDGDIDEVRIYSSALSATQISSLTTTSPLALQSAPTSLAATAGTQQVALTWTAAPGAVSYDVHRSTVSGGAATTVATGVTGTSYTNTGLTTGTTYYYTVMAVGATSESPNSNQATATTP